MGKRVLFLANHFITLYSFRKELIKQLIDAGHVVYLSLPADGDNKYFEDIGCKIVITKIDRRGMNPAKDLQLIAFYKKMIPEINPDIIFSYTVKPNIYGCLAHGKKYKQICNITGLGGTFLKDNALSKLVKILYKTSVKKSYKVFFQNRGDRDFFIENKMIRNNYELIPGSGCDIDEHSFISMPDDGTVRFMFMGRVMKLKGIDTYLEAAKNIKSKYPNTEFIIAGWIEQEQYKEVIEEYQGKGYVNYIGFRKDINEWTAKVNCVVLPSLGGEGVPNVLLESAATGRACIGSRINGTKDVIEDGITGFLFEVGNADELTNKIEQFVCMTPEARANMGKAGREKIVSEFDRNIVIRKYIREVENA